MNDQHLKDFKIFYAKLERGLARRNKEKPLHGEHTRKISVRIPDGFTVEQRVLLWHTMRLQAVMLPASTRLQRFLNSNIDIHTASMLTGSQEMPTDLEHSNFWLFMFYPKRKV